MQPYSQVFVQGYCSLAFLSKNGAAIGKRNRRWDEFTRGQRVFALEGNSYVLGIGLRGFGKDTVTIHFCCNLVTKGR